MGCNVHIYAEIRLKGAWHFVGYLFPQRNAMLFERLAGVRGDAANAIAPPRGIPSDVSAVVQWARDLEEGDDHHHSWLSSSEVRQVLAWCASAIPDQDRRRWEDANFGSLFQYPWSWCDDEFMAQAYFGMEDWRWVFWFDN